MAAKRKPLSIRARPRLYRDGARAQPIVKPVAVQKPGGRVWLSRQGVPLAAWRMAQPAVLRLSRAGRPIFELEDLPQKPRCKRRNGVHDDVLEFHVFPCTAKVMPKIPSSLRPLRMSLITGRGWMRINAVERDISSRERDRVVAKIDPALSSSRREEARSIAASCRKNWFELTENGTTMWSRSAAPPKLLGGGAGLEARPLSFGLGHHLAHDLIAYDLKSPDVENARFLSCAAAIEINPQVHRAALHRGIKSGEPQGSPGIRCIRHEHPGLARLLLDMHRNRRLAIEPSGYL